MANKPEAKEYTIEHDAKRIQMFHLCTVCLLHFWAYETCYVSDVEIRKATGRKTYIMNLLRRRQPYKN